MKTVEAMTTRLTDQNARESEKGGGSNSTTSYSSRVTRNITPATPTGTQTSAAVYYERAECPNQN